MDNRNHVKKISILSGVHVDLVRTCIRDLVRMGFVQTVPIFQFRNSYTPTQEISRLRNDADLRRRLVTAASADPDNPVTFKEVHRMVTEFKYGAKVSDVLCLSVQSRGVRMDLQSMQEAIRLLLLEGVLRRIYRYPVWEPIVGPGGVQESETPVAIRERMNGNAHFDEICCHFDLEAFELDAIIENDPGITIIQK